MNAIANLEPPSVLNSMATHYGMDKAAFNATLRATVMPKDASNEQAAAFLLVAREHGLNPFTREIFAFPAKGGGIQPVVSVDGWMKLINSHPKFDGMRFTDHLDSAGAISSMTCHMHRKDRTHPVEVTEYMSECKRDTDTWRRWPARMLRHKCAIQASRYAFGFAGILEPDEAERADEVKAWDDYTEEEKLAIRKKQCDEAVKANEETVSLIKECITRWDVSQDENELYTVAETWYGLSNEVQMALYLAPSKGGCFTTHERDIIKTKLPRDVP